MNIFHGPQQMGTKSEARSGLPFVLAMLVAGFLLPEHCLAQPASGAAANAASMEAGWVRTGNLNFGRAGHTATLLPDGKVLVAGGAIDGDAVDSAELYDPTTGAWSVTGGAWSVTGRMGTAHGHTATLLPNGQVLVVGGVNLQTGAVDLYSNLRVAELYDPGTGMWTRTGAPATGRFDHTATLLKDGRVLVAGGGAMNRIVADAELYDPATGSWSRTGRLITERLGHRATLLQDGRVLVTGGSDDADMSFGLPDAEIYDPVAGTWSRAPNLHVPRYGHTATLLPNGKVLVAGGDSLQGCVVCSAAQGKTWPPNNSAELFDPATGIWTVTDNLITGRSFHTASLLPNGEVMVVGGYTYTPPGPGAGIGSAERYDPGSALWRNTGDLETRILSHTATLLPNGKVLVAGVSAPGGEPNRAYLYDSAVVPGTIGAGFTGSWYDPAQNGHGFALEVLPGQPMQLLASWFTFAPQGGQAWIVGLGQVNGNQAVVQAYQSVGSGGRFPPKFDAANVHQESWGTLTFTFSDCDHGHVDWVSTAPGYGGGGMDLTRLTLPAGLTC